VEKVIDLKRKMTKDLEDGRVNVIPMVKKGII
jgi:hypothetical protein